MTTTAQILHGPVREPDSAAQQTLSYHQLELLGLLSHLCSAHPDPAGAYNWLLRWLAYPLQHQGAKMGRAVFMHGPPGCGKTTFFAAIAGLYGENGVQLGHSDLASHFNPWASGARFVLFDDLDRVRPEEAGRINTMITEPAWVVRTKYRPARREDNAANFVFLSNAPDALPISPGNPRYFVCAAPAVQYAADIERVHACLMSGGLRDLRDYLLRLPLGDFGPHTPPPNAQSIGETP